MDKKLRGGFYNFSSFSLVNHSLKKHFLGLPDIDFDYINVEKILPRRTLLNLVSTIWFYKKDLIKLRRSVRGMLIHNIYYFDQIKKKAIEVSKKNNFDFTFQTQSLWDASCPGTPHFIYTDHTELAYLRYNGFERRIYPYKWINREREVYLNANKIFTTSNFAKKSIVEDYKVDSGKIQVVYSGINIDSPKKIPVKNYNSKNILFIGVQWERKGGPFLIEAFKKIIQKNKNVTLTIIGCRPPINIPGVEILGFVEKKNLIEYFSKAQVFCMPSVIEPSSVALVEAYAHGLPVITTDVGGSSDRVIDSVTGFLVDYANVNQLALKLLTLLENPEMCKQFAYNGLQLLKEKFTWSVVIDKILTEIKIIMADKIDSE